MDKLKENGCESYKERCGEIFLTFLGNLNIHCTLCETIYKSYEAYASHIYEEHFKNLEQRNSENVVKPDFINEETKEITSLLKIEMESSENEILNEEEFPIDSLLHSANISENDSLDSPDLYDKTQWSETSLPFCSRKLRSSVKCKKMTNSTSNKKLKRKIKEEGLPKESVNAVSSEDETFLDYEPKSSDGSEDSEYLPIISKKPKNGSAKYEKNSTSVAKDKGKKVLSKKNECLQCKKVYKATKDDRINNRYHTCERKFLCSYCGLSFSANSTLKRHVRTHTNQRDYKCEICGKAFYVAYTLKGHMMGHSTERPFACETCPATFSRKTALRTHIKLHENKLEYECKVCERRFNQQAGLVSHMKVVHKTT